MNTDKRSDDRGLESAAVRERRFFDLANRFMSCMDAGERDRLKEMLVRTILGEKAD